MKFEDGKYVLVLDDFEEECDIAAASIQLPCMWVSHPGKVLRNPKAFKPMAILLDQDFGPESEKEGIDYLPELRLNYPYIPIIMVTSSIDFTLRMRSIEKKADNLIRKPYHPGDLKAEVDVQLALYRLKSTPEAPQFYRDLKIDKTNMLLKGQRGEVKISETSIRILTALITANGNKCSNDLLKERGWPRKAPVGNNYYKKMHELSKIIDETSAEVTLSKDYGAGYFLDLKIEMPQFSDLRVETSTNTLLINDKKIKLTPIEAKILLMLMEAQGEKISGDLIRTKCEKDFSSTNTSFDLVMHTMALHINLNTNNTRLNNKDGSFFLKAGRARPAKALASAS